jgi:hypothetical protein
MSFRHVATTVAAFGLIIATAGAASAQSASVRERANAALQSQCMQTAVDVVPGNRNDTGIADNRVWVYLSCIANSGSLPGR